MFEPFNLLLGLFLLVNLLYTMIHNPNMKILNFSQKNKNILLKLFGLNLFYLGLNKHQFIIFLVI